MKWKRMGLSNKSHQELIELIACDDTALDDDDEEANELLRIVHEFPEVKSLTKERDELEAKNKELASQNYGRQPEFHRNRQHLLEDIEEINQLKLSLTTRRVKPLMESLNSIGCALEACINESESTSDSLSSDFLKGSLPHDEFIETYVKSRKEFYKRRLLADRYSKERDCLEASIPKLERGQSYPPVPAQRRRRSKL